MKTASVSHAFSARPRPGKTHIFSELPSAGTAPRKTVDGVDLVAMPVFPASPFSPGLHDSRHRLRFTYDADQLMAAHAPGSRRLPLDIEHNTEGRGTDTRARGWLHSLSTADHEPEAGFEPGSLYAWVELNSLGKAEHADRLYGYTSAVATGEMLADDHVHFTRLRSLTMTNSPALEMRALFTSDAPESSAYTSKQPTEDCPMFLTQLRAALKLADTATEAEILEALTAALSAGAAEAQALVSAGFTVADVPTLVRSEALTAVQAELTAAHTALATVQAELTAMRQADAARTISAAVESVLAAGKATDAQRESLTALATANLEAFTAWAASAPKVISDAPDLSGKPAAGKDETFGLTAEEQATARTAGVSLETFATQLAIQRAALGL